MTLSIKQKTRNRSWTEILLEESEKSLRQRGAKRELTFRRMYFTVATWSLAGVLIYTSSFYIGAFYDFGQIIGYSQIERAKNAKENITKLDPKTQTNMLSPVINTFKLNRIYLLEGQKIEGSYVLPRGTKLTMFIKHCKTMPFIEVFKCKFDYEMEKTIKNRTAGTVSFTAPANGFYYFDTKGIKLPATEIRPHQDYRIIWRRAGTPKKP